MLLQTESLSKQYGAVHALRQCSMYAAQGEILGLLGPNGAGKTTLLRILLGFLKPTSGSASINGYDCYRQTVAAHRQLSYLPGEAHLFPWLTGRKCLEFFARLRPDSSVARATALADRLGLDLARRVRQMSTGMRQKLALAIALSPEVPLTILDEPTANLDPNARRIVLNLIREARDAGKSVLFSSHVLSEVEDVCDRAALLRDGQLVEVTVLAKLRRKHMIQARLNGNLSALPSELTSSVQVEQNGETATILTDGDLAPLLGWLAQQPIAELEVEPVGLRSIYDRHHP